MDEVNTQRPSRGDAFKADLFTWLQSLVVALTVMIVLFTFVGRVIGVEGPSMIPTLHEGDMIVLRSIGYTPTPGDVVVLTKQSFSDRPIVKRVIATAGQMVRIDYESGKVYVDGIALDEPYINEPMTARPSSQISDVTVPDGALFVMGDNRNHSSDSRYPPIGLIDARCVIGQAVFILFPFHDFGAIR